MKLPIGVADLLSLGDLVRPCEPTWASIGLRTRSHPPPRALRHACSRAVVLCFDLATTVMTRLARPVNLCSGNGWPRRSACGARAAFGPLDVVRGVGCAARDVLFVDGRGVDVARADELGAAGVVECWLVTATGMGTVDVRAGGAAEDRLTGWVDAALVEDGAAECDDELGAALGRSRGIATGAGNASEVWCRALCRAERATRLSLGACAPGVSAPERARPTTTTAQPATVADATAPATIRPGVTVASVPVVAGVIGRVAALGVSAVCQAPRMVLEIADIHVKPGSGDDFVAAYRTVREVVATTPGCGSVRMKRSVESPDRFALLVEWETIEAHEQNFRATDRFATWRAAIGPYFDGHPLVEHFTDI